MFLIYLVSFQDIYIYVYIHILMNIRMNKFVLCGNEIKFVEKQRKLLQFFAPCGNKHMADSPVSIFHSFYFFEVI